MRKAVYDPIMICVPYGFVSAISYDPIMICVPYGFVSDIIFRHHFPPSVSYEIEDTSTVTNTVYVEVTCQYQMSVHTNSRRLQNSLQFPPTAVLLNH
jgi:hypothetical protein